MRKTATSFLVVFMCLFMIAGCYTGKTLEERIDDRERQYIINKVREEFKDDQDFKDLTIDVEENHVIIKAYLNVNLSQQRQIQVKQQLKNLNYSDKMEKLKDSMEKRYRIRPTLLTFEFFEGSGRSLVKF